MSIKDFFQTPYNFFKYWQAPLWLKQLLQVINDMMYEILKEVSQAYINYLKTEILVAASHNDWSGDQKFDYVFKKAKSGFVEFGVQLKDAELGALIKFVVLELKKLGVV